MSEITTSRALVAPRVPSRTLDVDLRALAVTGGLVAAAAWLAHRWWIGPETPVPPTWAMPSAQALFLLPAVLVLGLLALRLAVGGRPSSVTSERLSALAARWAGVSAAVTAGWLALTVVDLYGGLGRLTAADNVISVLSADEGAAAQLILLQIMTLTALFGSRVTGRAESAGLLVLVAVAVLAAFPFVPAGHGHGALGPSALVPLVAAYQVLAVAGWLGVLLAALHLRGSAPALRRQLAGAGMLLTVGVVLTGVVAVLAGLAYPGLPTPPVIAVAGLVGVGIVAHVGRSQRLRVLDLAVARGGLARAGLLAGEVVVMGAVVLLACWLPIGG